MRAFTIDRFKTRGRVDELPLPDVGPGEVRVRITAAGVNPVDWKIRGGSMPHLPLPRVLGQDLAGVVDALGGGVTRFAVGDRVVGCARSHGAYAELTTIADNAAAEPLAKIPDGVDDAVACALPTPGLTALGCLNAAGVGEGTPVLIVGAGGAVGALATQLAVLRGAHVVASVMESDAERVRAFGPRQTIAASDADAVIRAVTDAYPEGVPAVLDFVNDGDTLKRFVAVTAPGGTVVTTIHVADEAWFAARGRRAVNLVMSETPESSPDCLDELTRLVRERKLTVDIASEAALDEAGDILDRGERRALHGKFVLRPGRRAECLSSRRE